MQGFVRRIYYEKEDVGGKLCWDVIPSLKWRVSAAGRDQCHQVVATLRRGVLSDPVCSCVSG